MKKKLLFALPLVALLASCSYGSINEIDLETFKQFYNGGDLKDQINYDFAFGDNLSITVNDSAAGIDEYTELELSTASLPDWQNPAKQKGNALKYNLLGVYSDEDEISNYLKIDCSLSSKTKKEYSEVDEESEEEQEQVLLGQSEERKRSIKMIDASSVSNRQEILGDLSVEPSVDKSGLFLKEDETVTYYAFYPVIVNEDETDLTERFETNPSYVCYNYSYSFAEKTVDIDSEASTRVTTVRSVTARIEYTEYAEYDDARALKFSQVVNEEVTTEVLSGGSYVGSTRITDKETCEASYDERSQTGTPKYNDRIIHKEENYKNGVYVKDEENSTDVVNDSYTYDIPTTYKDTFTVSTMLSGITNNLVFDQFINIANALMHSYFADFETHLTDSNNKEIIEFGKIYQFRVRIDEQTIKQYSFLKGEKDILQSVITFKGNNLEESSKIILSY